MASVRARAAIGATVALVAVGATALWLALRDPAPEPPPARPEPVVVEGLVAKERPFEFQMVHGACELVSIVTADDTIYPRRDDFCVVEFHVANTGDADARLDPACQFLIDRGGTRHAQRLDVLRLDPGSREALLRPIPAGGLVEHGALYYDVAAGTRPAFVELHASCDSRGVQLEVVEPPEEQGG